MISSKLRTVIKHYCEPVKRGLNKMMNCPMSGQATHTRSSLQFSGESKESDKTSAPAVSEGIRP